MSKMITPNRLKQAMKEVNENSMIKDSVNEKVLEQIEKIDEKAAKSMYMILQIANQKVDNSNIKKNASVQYYDQKSWEDRKLPKNRIKYGKKHHLKKIFAHLIIVHDPTVKVVAPKKKLSKADKALIEKTLVEQEGVTAEDIAKANNFDLNSVNDAITELNKTK